MQIYLVRHTTPDIVPGICYGRQDLGLAASFDAEAAAVRSKLQHLAAPAAEGAAAFRPRMSVTRIDLSAGQSKLICLNR